MANLPLYWLRAWNFGDLLNPILYRFITMQEAEWSDQSPKILAIGSVMSIAKPGDIVWGSGCISADTPLSCDNTTEFRAVRGPHTAELLSRHGIDLPANIPFGEPSSLLPRFIPPSKDRNLTIGFLPHYIDYGQVRQLPGDVRLLSPATEPIQLIEQITSCRLIVSSSLHGLCVAEAYGIPAVWVELADNIVGGQFKFQDYYAATGRTIQPINWRIRYDWHEAEQAALSWTKPDFDLDGLMQVCPFTDKAVFTKLSASCQIRGLNVFYERYFPGQRFSTFVEVGGNDGYLWSNTWGLAEIGWRGLYYEPVTELADKCRLLHAHNKVTVINSAVGTCEGAAMLYPGNIATTSRFVAGTDLYAHGNSLELAEITPCITLNKSLAEQDIPHNFDLLVIDVCGGEPDVLGGIDLTTWKPEMLIIATHKGHDGWDFNAEEIDRRVSRWYDEVFHDHINSIYIRREGK